MEGEEEGEQRKNVPKDDGTLALGIDFGTCRISSAIWNKNKKGTQFVKDPVTNDIYFPAILSFDNNEGVEMSESIKLNEEKKEVDYGIVREDAGVEQIPSMRYNLNEEEKKEEEVKEEGKEIEQKDINHHFVKELKEYPPNPEKIVYNIKQILGQKYNSDYLQKIKSNLIFKIDEEVSKKNKRTNRPVLIVDNKRIPFEKIASYLFKKCIDDASKNFNNKVGNVVISIPHSFNKTQRQAIKDAVKIAGVDNVHIINDTTAALIYYAFKYHIKKTEYFLICDMGQNKLDCAVVCINKQNCIKVLSSGGDNRFGGEQFNQPLIKLLYENYLNDGGSDFIRNNKPKEKFNFFSSIEMAKRNLTFMKETEINLPKIDGENDIIQSLTREDFDKLNEKNYEHVLECIDQVLKESKIDRNQLNNVILIGEGLRIPKLIQLLEEKFEDCNFITDLYNIISQGAAIYAAHWGNKLNVDKFKNFKVYDITQLSLGIRTEGDLISTILKRGSRIPVKVTKSFLTTQDNQKKIKFEVYQGERKFSKDNDLLCRIILKGISEKLRGLVEIDVTFEVNEDGILIVTANEKDKDEKAEINAFANGNMEEEDIKNLIKNAEYARKDDEEKEERVKASLRLNELILKFTALFSEDEELWAIIEEYRNWLMHAGTVPKEEYDKKRIELMRKMPRDEDFEDPKEEEKKEEEKKEEEKKNEEQKGSEVANPAA